MATSNLLQRLDGETLYGESASNRRTIEEFVANGTIALGDVVAFDTSKTGADRVLYITRAAIVALGNGLAVGVSLDAVTAGDRCRVVVSGYAGSVLSNGVVALGDMLTAAPTALASVTTRVVADVGPAFAVALEAGPDPACWIYPRW